MSQRFGATPEAWDHFAVKLGLGPDLLPVVSNPNAEISPLSKMAALGKTPSMYNRQRLVAGLPKWSQFSATEHVIQRWKSEADYGICIQTRAVRAFDIDVDDEAKARAIADAIHSTVGFFLPERSRPNSGKKLLAFTYHRPLTKRVVPVDGGMVEILADGQQFIAAGQHPSGVPYCWGTMNGTPVLPEVFPVLTGEQFEKIWVVLTTILATGEPKIAREKRQGSADPDLIVHDGVADWLVENWETYDVGSDGQVFIQCPFEAEHSTETGPSSTAYFPAGTGGYQRGHFVCLHAHCSGREDAAFLDACGYNLAQFENLDGTEPAASAERRLPEVAGSTDVAGPADRQPAPQEEWPPLIRDKGGKIESTAENLVAAIHHGGMIFRHVAYDAFTDNLVWIPSEESKVNAKWRTFTDADMISVRIELERRGFKPMGKDLLRDSIHHAAHLNKVDTAIDWLTGLRWDGVPRIDTFAIDVWGWPDSPYSRAVGAYLWSAMAGRVLEPGVRADMAPILVGLQGIKKTTAIQLMVPTEDHYAEIKLTDKDDDLSRKLRGKLIGELEELRGLNSRAIEEIKAFVTRRKEAWVPKYKEFEAFFWRRCLLIGTTNDDEFLGDPTGERRWLPGECGVVNVELLVATRTQLWAEGATRFAMNGVEWQDAERLAAGEHARYKITDTWERAIRTWLETPQIGGSLPMDKGFVTILEILASALGVPTNQANRTHEMRVAKALRHLGLRAIDLGEGKVYVQ